MIPKLTPPNSHPQTHTPKLTPPKLTPPGTHHSGRSVVSPHTLERWVELLVSKPSSIPSYEKRLMDAGSGYKHVII